MVLPELLMRNCTVYISPIVVNPFGPNFISTSLGVPIQWGLKYYE